MHRYEKHFPEAGSSTQYRSREKHYQRMCIHSKAVLVDSEIGKQQSVESYHPNPDKIYVLPFVPPGYIHQIDESVNIFSIYNIPDKYIFYPAQFWEHKNHKALIRAMALNKEKGIDLNLVFVGEKKNAFNSINDLITELCLNKSITILDYIPDNHIPLFYRYARAMIMPTFFGPTNIPPLEAFATGCPAAVSNIYAMPEQVGEAALLFDPNSDEEIAETLFRLWTDDKLLKELINKGDKKTEEWNQVKFNERFKSIINEILGT
jgi:glycosyltransferase involved in cell wall biosynthesis